MFSKSTLFSLATLAFSLSASAAPAANCPAPQTVTVTAGPAATPKGNNAAGNSKSKGNNTPPPADGSKGNFGRCSVPQIKFEAGLDGRTEKAFAPIDKQSFNHGSAQEINTIVSFICQQLGTTCGADKQAVQTCTKAGDAANAAAFGGGQADAFNGAMGGNTNFGGSKSGSQSNNNGKNNGKGSATSTTSASKSTSTSKANNGASNNANNNNNGKNNGKGSATSTTSASKSTSTSKANNGNNGNGKGGNPQTSLTLDPAVIAKGFESDGQQVPTAGQVPSLTSSNNFINFCLTAPNKPITNGQQIKTGSCNPAPIGLIAATDRMPSSKFTFPTNFGTIKANTPFTIKMAVNNLKTGNFVNAQSNYYSAPQQLDATGTIIGHTHVVIEQIPALDSTAVTDPTKFAFFKGVNGAAVNGVVTADVTAGLPAGNYRLASINAAANHQPVIVAVAQHGSLDDMVYFTVTDSGAPAKAAPAPAPAKAAPVKPTATVTPKKGGKN